MNRLKHWCGVLGAFALLAGCGGGGGETSGNKLGFTSIASFGDSLSDVGTHAVGSVAVIGGGRYTINSGNPSAPAKIWLDHLSAQLGLPAPCAAVTGLNPTSTFAMIPGGGAAAVTSRAGCTNHAQGGSRVSHPIGPANPLTAPNPNHVVGQLTYPLTQQVSEYLSRNGGSFSGKTLVTVLAGGNDAFMQSAVAAAAAAIVDQTTALAFMNTATNIGGWTSDQINAVLLAASPAAGQAAVLAGLTANMTKAGADLATLVKNEIVGKGAKYVLVINLPDLSSSPFGLENPQNAPVANAMAQAFNAGLQSGLASVAGVTVADAYTTSRDQYNNAAAYGLTNVTNRACSTVFSPTTNLLAGAALGCNVGNVISGDTSKYLFADDVHPTPYGHQLLAQFAAKVLATAGLL